MFQIPTITQTEARNGKHVNEKINELGRAIRENLDLDEPKKSVGDRVMDQFTSQFHTFDTADQYRILTSMPREDNRKFLQDTFRVSERQARRAKQMQEQDGLLSTPNPKPGKRLSQDIITLIQQFFESDHVSRQMPGKRDCVSMMVNGVKEKVQKRQILCTINEAFLLFKDENPNIKIGFSKFSEAQPKNIVLPGATGTHVVCVCSYHQNQKLMMELSQIATR